MISCEHTKKAPGFDCTGSDESQVWAHLHDKVPDKFNCEHCKGHYVDDMIGYHDMINVGLGKPAFNAPKLFEFQKRINDTVKFCRAEKLC